MMYLIIYITLISISFTAAIGTAQQWAGPHVALPSVTSLLSQLTCYWCSLEHSLHAIGGVWLTPYKLLVEPGSHPTSYWWSLAHTLHAIGGPWLSPYTLLVEPGSHPTSYWWSLAHTLHTIGGAWNTAYKLLVEPGMQCAHYGHSYISPFAMLRLVRLLWCIVYPQF